MFINCIHYISLMGSINPSRLSKKAMECFSWRRLVDCHFFIWLFHYVMVLRAPITVVALHKLRMACQSVFDVCWLIECPKLAPWLCPTPFPFHCFCILHVIIIMIFWYSFFLHKYYTLYIIVHQYIIIIFFLFLSLNHH
jgi:hypothetical protein